MVVRENFLGRELGYLQKKVLVTLALTMVVLVLVLFLSDRLILLHSMQNAERNKVVENVSRVQNTLNDELTHMKGVTNNLAAFDDSYNFVNNGNAFYIQDNLLNSAFNQYGVNLILFLNSSGKVVFGKCFDLQTQQRVPFPEKVLTMSFFIQRTTARQHRA